jgi:hypothetical protein
MMPWRTYQRVRTVAIHFRDLGACLLAGGSLAALIWVLAL